MKLYVKEFAPGLFHVMKDGIPIYDDSRDGNDKPAIFIDSDTAHECMAEIQRRTSWAEENE